MSFDPKSPSERRKVILRRRNASKPTITQPKNLPVHIACLSGDKGTLKGIVSSVPRRHLDIKDSLGRTPLILTVTRNFVECGAVLMKHGVTVDSTDNAGQTALHIAAHKGYHQFVKLLLTYKASWMQRDYFGATALHMAAISSNVKGLSAILKYVKRAEIDVQDDCLKTALHWAAAYGMNENIKILLAQGANSCIPDIEGKTPFHYAVANSEPEALDCARTLSKKELCLINWQDYEGRSPLHIAVLCGNEELVNFLASKENCNTDLLDNSFCTPLHCAAKRGYSEKADILLKKRASYLSVDDHGATPLHYAAHNNHAATVKVFTSHSYIIDNYPDVYGRNALMWGAIKAAEDSIKILAMCPNANLSFADRNGINALHAAAIYGHAGIVEQLVKLGMSVDVKDIHGMTPFLKACEFGRLNAAQALLNLGANMKEKDANGRAALHWCALRGSAYLSQILILHPLADADFNIQDSYRMTPLHYTSAVDDYINCTCVLVESGADPNIEDFEGKTPLHAAVLRNRAGIARYLLEHGAYVNSMFFINDWVTPLDCAMRNKNEEIITLLKSFGGICAQTIKEFAAVTIQMWFRKKIKDKKRTFKGSYRLPPFTSFTCSSSFSSNKESKCIPLTEMAKHFYQTVKYSNPYHMCKGCFHKIICSHDCGKLLVHRPSYATKHKAALIIQKAWKRYILKTRFARVRSEVEVAFPNQEERLAAEENWKYKLNYFYQQLDK